MGELPIQVTPGPNHVRPSFLIPDTRACNLRRAVVASERLLSGWLMLFQLEETKFVEQLAMRRKFLRSNTSACFLP